MDPFSEESKKIFEKMFDEIPKKNDYITRKEFNNAIKNKKIGENIHFFCKVSGKPIFFIFDQCDKKKEGKIYKEDFVNLLSKQREKKNKK